MPDKPSESAETREVRTIRQLVRLMHKFDLTAIDLVEGETRIRLRRRGPEPATVVPAATGPTSPTPVMPAFAREESQVTSAPSASGTIIESPMVGTFYSSSAPDAPPFVSIGSSVRPETTVCVIEAMKVFTDIPAGVAGTVTEILVKNGQPVEYGQPLFRVSQG